MGSEGDIELISSSTLKLALFSSTETNIQDSPERAGMVTRPLRTSVSVPFRWEEEPGKPKPCTTLTTYSNPNSKCLQLPPRLVLMGKNSNTSKLPSPTTVLDDVGSSSSRSRFQNSSFRMGGDCYGSFRKMSSSETLGDNNRGGQKGGFGSWRRKGRREIGGGSYVFPSSSCSVDRDSEEGEGSGRSSDKITRAGSFPLHLWEGLKQVVPWRSSRKVKKDGLLT